MHFNDGLPTAIYVKHVALPRQQLTFFLLKILLNIRPKNGLADSLFQNVSIVVVFFF